MRRLFCAGLLLLIHCGDDTVMMDPDASLACAVTCDDGLYCNGEERCDPTSPAADDDGCVFGEAPCELCDEAADSCDGRCPDADADGFEDIACGGDDCDDSDPDRYPGNAEVCGGRDDHDEDCDPTTFGADGDRDGDGEVSALCCNDGACGSDCDDNDVTVLTGQIEICDSRDNDCDGSVDEEENDVPWYPDMDTDLFGDPTASPVISCTPIPDHSIRPFDCDATPAPREPRRAGDLQRAGRRLRRSRRRGVARVHPLRAQSLPQRRDLRRSGQHRLQLRVHDRVRRRPLRGHL